MSNRLSHARVRLFLRKISCESMYWFSWSLLFKDQLWQPEGCGHAPPRPSRNPHRPADPPAAICVRMSWTHWWWASGPPGSPWQPHVLQTHSPGGRTLRGWSGDLRQVHTQGLARPSHHSIRTKGTHRWTQCFSLGRPRRLPLPDDSSWRRGSGSSREGSSSQAP